MAETYRADDYESKYQTKIFREYSSSKNPYSESDVECYGYNQLELSNNLNFVDYLFLLVRGKLPEESEAALLNKALIALSSPGVRHPATRAAVAAGVGKTVPENVLPTALLVLNGKSGAAGVQESMRFLRRAKRDKHIEDFAADNYPGFGEHYGGANEFLSKVYEELNCNGQWAYLTLGNRVITALQKNVNSGIGWQLSGLFAAVFCDLGVQPRLAPGLMQSICAPALLVQGMENANKPTTVLPFVEDKDYGIRG